jgi:AraC family transcriptional regulator, regulatory protein of adaptative response / DNA-3-methyladenine glycosylase II
MPFAGPDVLDFIGGRTIAGIESWDGVTYRRSMALPGGHGTVTLRAADDHVEAEFDLADSDDLDTAVQRVRRLLDLDADAGAVDAALATEPVMARLIAARPGRRAPGSVDPFETSIRAVIGQQISVAGARTVAASLVRAVGEPLDLDDPGLTCVFPAPAAVVEAPDTAFPMPTSRRDTLRRLARAVADGDIVLEAGADPDATRAALLAVKGIGPWTADYVTMRGLSDPDIFLASDLGVRHGLDQLVAASGERPDPSVWAPWRSYAVHHIWAHLGARKEHTT